MTMLRFVPVFLLVGCMPRASETLPVNEPTMLDYPVPAFHFTERSGKLLANADLHGKVWVASFVFTRCTGPCPQVTATVAKLHSELKDAELRFVTFTIDPERDTLADLNRYAENYRADPARWFFLTGPEKEVHAFARTGFKLLAERSATPKPGEEFDHSSRLAVVDQKGVIRGTFEGFDRDAAKRTPAEREERLRPMKELIAKLLAQ